MSTVKDESFPMQKFGVSSYESLRGPVTPDAFEHVFGDWLTMPASLETVAVTDEMLSTEQSRAYNQAVEWARDEIYSFQDISIEQQEVADLMFLEKVFLSSDAAEMRFVGLGLKPVTLCGIGYGNEEAMASNFGSLPVSMLSAHRVHTEAPSNYPDIGFTNSPFASMDSDNFKLGCLYNKSAIQRVVGQNRAILDKLGYDTAKLPDEIVDDVFGGGTDPVAESLLMGYSPMTAVCFYLVNPYDLGTETDSRGLLAAQNGNPNARRDGFWRSLRLLLAPEQLAMAQAMAIQPEATRDLGIIDDMTNNLDYILATPRNQHVQEVWQESGMTNYLLRMRAQLCGDNTAAYCEYEKLM